MAKKIKEDSPQGDFLCLQAQPPAPTVCPRPCFTVLHSTWHLKPEQSSARGARNPEWRSSSPALAAPSRRLTRLRSWSRLLLVIVQLSQGAGPTICPPRGSFRPEFPGSDTLIPRARAHSHAQTSFPASSKSRDITTGVFVVRDAKTTEA